MTLDRNTLLEAAKVAENTGSLGNAQTIAAELRALAAAQPEEPTVVWSEPRQMWNGQWYRVGTSTGAIVPALPDTVCVPREEFYALMKCVRAEDSCTRHEPMRSRLRAFDAAMLAAFEQTK